MSDRRSAVLISHLHPAATSDAVQITLVSPCDPRPPPGTSGAVRVRSR